MPEDLPTPAQSVETVRKREQKRLEQAGRQPLLFGDAPTDQAVCAATSSVGLGKYISSPSGQGTAGGCSPGAGVTEAIYSNDRSG